MEKPVFAVRVDDHYIEAFDKLPGATRRERMTRLLNYALITGYGSEVAPVKKVDEDWVPQVKALQDQVKTLDAAFGILNEQFLHLKDLLGY